jgi:hypothetical protein
VFYGYPVGGPSMALICALVVALWRLAPKQKHSQYHFNPLSIT